MFDRSESKLAPQTEAIEFEITDFATARRALDELPPGVQARSIAQPGYWEARRRPPVSTDRALGGAAMQWVMNLPPALRPASTCARFPRVVNRVADAWLDSHRCAQVFEHLLADRRPSRRGFPLSVVEELRALYAYRLAGAAPAARA
jgi:hypothetical protein